VVASPSHNALLIVRRPAAEEATSVRPHHLHALAVLTQTRYHSLTRAVYQVIPRRSSMNRWSGVSQFGGIGFRGDAGKIRE